VPQPVQISYEIIATTGMLLISAHILDPVRMLQSFRKCTKGMDSNSEDETSYTTQHQKVILKYVEEEYCTKHRRLPVINPKNDPINKLFYYAVALGSA
jgi:hypothetical protein